MPARRTRGRRRCSRGSSVVNRAYALGVEDRSTRAPAALHGSRRGVFAPPDATRRSHLGDALLAEPGRGSPATGSTHGGRGPRTTCLSARGQARLAGSRATVPPGPGDAALLARGRASTRRAPALRDARPATRSSASRGVRRATTRSTRPVRVHTWREPRSIAAELAATLSGSRRSSAQGRRFRMSRRRARLPRRSVGDRRTT